MNGRYPTRRFRRKLGCVFGVLGMIIWALAATPVSIPHFEARALGVIAGGAAAAVGIILFATAV
jgi:hypothetical protein